MTGSDETGEHRPEDDRQQIDPGAGQAERTGREPPAVALEAAAQAAEESKAPGRTQRVSVCPAQAR